MINQVEQWIRCDDFPIPGVGACRVYQKRVDGGHLNVLVGHEFRNDEKEKSWHISVSHRNGSLVNVYGGPLAGRFPTWDEIKEVRYRFAPADVNMAILFPPMEHYVNLHRTTIHLWQVPLELAELA